MIGFLGQWPKGRQNSRLRSHQAGMSLLEVAMLMVIMTLAMAPLIKNLGGPGSSQGNAARMVGMQSKEVLLANTLIEQALANNFQSFNCDGSFNMANPLVSFPGTGAVLNYPAGTRCVNSNYAQPLYYQWTVRNAAQPNSLMPVGNQYYHAVLNVYTSQAGGTPILTLPTSFFYNSNAVTTPQTKTGIIVIQDISGSMIWGQNSGDNYNAAGEPTPWMYPVVASPYLTYRYSDPAIGFTPPNSIQLAWAAGANPHNDQLDIVTAKLSDDPSTPWDDRYFGNGALGMGATGISDCTKNSNWNAANWKGSKLYSTYINTSPWYPYNFFPYSADYADQAHLQNTLITICNRSPDWNTMMNNNVSRIEAARGSLLNFIVSMEGDPTLYQNTKLGFETFSSPGSASGNDPSGQGYDVRVPLESIDQNSRYPNMRRQVSWLNREGPGQIVAFNGTNYTAPLKQAAGDLFNDKTLSNRFILFVSDGEPNGPGDTHGQLSALATKIGNGTYPGANGESTTIFSLGLMSSDPGMPQYLRDDMAMNTPGGQYFQAQNVGDVSSIFDQIKYQIQKVILLNKSNRYNVDFT